MARLTDSEVVTVTVDDDNTDVLKPLIELAAQMTVKDFNESDLIKLRELFAHAVELVNANTVDPQDVADTANALSALLEQRFGNIVTDVQIGNYETTDPNYADSNGVIKSQDQVAWINAEGIVTKGKITKLLE